MKKSVNILFFIFVLILVGNILSQENTICVPDDSGSQKCYSGFTEEMIPEYAKNYNEFKALPPNLQKYILETEEYREKFLQGFLEAAPEEQAKFLIDIDSNENFLLSNDILIDGKNLRTIIFNSLDSEKKSALIKSINDIKSKEIRDIYFEGLYGEGKGEYSGLKKVEIIDDKGELKWDGLKLIAPDGGYLNFGEGPDHLSKFITKIKYENGKFYVTFGNDIELEYKEGTPAPNGGFFKDGKLVGGDKLLSFLYEVKKDQKHKKFSVSFIEENGKKYTEIRISGNSDSDSVGLRGIDVNGNDFFIGLAKENIASATGKIYDAIIRIDENNIMEVMSGHLQTKGYGEYKFSNNYFTPLIGNFFNEPGKGVMTLEQRIREKLGPKISKKIMEKAREIFGEGVVNGRIDPKLISTPVKFKESGDEFGDAVMKIIQDEAGITREESESLSQSIFFNIGKKIGEVSQNIPVSPTRETFEKLASDLRAFSSGGLASFIEGKGGLFGPAIGESFSETLIELSNPGYKKYVEEGKNYLYIENNINPIDGKNFKEVRAAGGFIAIDITNFNGKINVLSVKNTVSNEEIEKGERIYISNNGFLIDSTKKNLYDSRRLSYKATTPIDLLETDSGKWTLLKNNYGGLEFHKTDQIYYRTGANQYIGGLFRARAANYIGGARFEGTLGQEYLGNNPDASIEIFIDPSGRRFVVSKARETASISTNDIAWQYANSFEETLKENIEKIGGYSAFRAQLKYFDFMEKKAKQDSSIDLTEIFGPNYGQLSAINHIIKSVETDGTNNVFDTTMRDIASAGSVSYGIPFTMNNKGAYLGGTKIESDGVVTGLFVDGAFKNPPPNQRTMSLLEASRQGGGAKKPAPKSIIGMIDEFKNKEISQTQTSASASQKSQIDTPTKTKKLVCVRRGLFGRRSYCYYYD